MPENKIKKIKLPNNVEYEIIPTALQDGTTSYKAVLPTLTANSTIVLADNSALPCYLVESTDNVVSFISTNSLSGKPFILKINGRGASLAIFVHATSNIYSFELENISDVQSRYVGNGDLTGLTFADITSSTYLKNYEIEDNKVTSISASSTDTQYPSAKCVYDAIDNTNIYPVGDTNYRINFKVVNGQPLLEYEEIV